MSDRDDVAGVFADWDARDARQAAEDADRDRLAVETATREHFGQAYAPPGGPIDGVTKLAQASFRAGYVIGHADALAAGSEANR